MWSPESVAAAVGLTDLLKVFYILGETSAPRVTLKVIAGDEAKNLRPMVKCCLVVTDWTHTQNKHLHYSPSTKTNRVTHLTHHTDTRKGKSFSPSW